MSNIKIKSINVNYNDQIICKKIDRSNKDGRKRTKRKITGGKKRFFRWTRYWYN